MRRGLISVGIFSLVLAGLFFDVAHADRFSSTSYVIDASVVNSIGGTGTSTSYKLTTSGGEAVIGNGSAGSYKMGYGYISNLDKSLSLTVQPSGLVAAYMLDETSGTLIADQSIYSAYGTMQGTLASTTGKLSTALTFDGSTQAVMIGNKTQTQITAGTVETWIKSSTGTGTLAAVVKASGFWIGLSAGKAAAYDWTTGITTADTTTITDGNWHHLAITLNSGVANGSTLYVDGAAKKTFTWTPPSQTGSLVIGAAYGGSYSQYFNGAIDHTKIFNRMLSADEIAAEYSAQNTGIASGLSLGTITPGTSNIALTDVIVQTDSNGYTLAVNQNNDLMSGAYTIPAVSGSIASPASWTEGTTKGLGFTLTATNATAIPGTWSSGANYAALPGTATTFYSRTGTQSSTGDYITMRLRADVATTQPTTSGNYTNTMTITGTITP
jgi:hypothetical protein